MEEYWVDYAGNHYKFYLVDIDEKGLFYATETYRVKTAFSPRKGIQKYINGQLYVHGGAYHEQGERFRTLEELIKWLDGQPYIARKFFIKSVFGGK